MDSATASPTAANENTCSVCLESLQGEVGACIPCGHVVHGSCFRQWAAASARGQQRRCPSCNATSTSFCRLFIHLEEPPPPPTTTTRLSFAVSSSGSEDDEEPCYNNLIDGDRHGCFVYQSLGYNPVRRYPSFSDDAALADVPLFGDGDLVSVDCIRSARSSAGSDSPFLRLSDGSGWVFRFNFEGTPCWKRLNVKDGLWTFYADNYPTGIALRRHPIDSSDYKVQPEVFFLPLQKIVCDKQVHVSGVNFYRVQGTEGWVFDKRGSNFMMIPESKVLAGLFVYKAKTPLAVRSATNVGDECKTPITIFKNELIAADFLRESPYGPDNGPFLRLTDGSGFLFVKKYSELVMDAVPVEEGHWVVRIENLPVGIALRRQPIDRPNMKILPERVFAPNEHTVCDLKLSADNGMNFYRVKGTTGWIFDRRGDDSLLTVLQVGSKRQRIENNSAAREEDAIRSSLKKCDLELSSLRHKREHIIGQIKKIDKSHANCAERRREEERVMARQIGEMVKAREQEEAQIKRREQAAQKELERQKRGDKVSYCIYHSKEVALDGSAQLFAMGDKASLMLSESYGWSYTSGLATNIWKLLHTRALSHPRPTYVALGRNSRYYIKFQNGRTAWSGGLPSSFDEIVRNKTVKFVAFGTSMDSYVVGTSSNISWCNVSGPLVPILRGSATRPIHSVSLGPSGEYFVAWKDGNFKGGGWSNAVNNEMGRLKRAGWHVRDVKFGADATYIIRYSSYSGPF